MPPFIKKIQTLFRSISPLFLPFLLSMFPVFLVIHFQGLQRQLAMEGEQEIWEEKVENRIEEFRASYSFEQQIHQLSDDFQNRLNLAVNRSPAKKLTGPMLSEEFRKTFQGFHRPPGTRLYAFTRADDGSSQLLTGNGLEEDFGRMIARSLAPITLNTLPSGTVKKEVNQRLAQIFGELMNSEQLFICRGRTLIQANFKNQVVQVFWNRISLHQKILGGFIILFPAKVDQQTALKYAMARHVWKKDPDFLPLLVPIRAAREALNGLFLEKESRQWGMARIVNLLRSGVDRDKIAGYGIVSETIPGLKIFRAAVSMELPYELWILRHEAAEASAAGIPKLVAISLWSLFWMGTLILVLKTGKPLQVSMKRWFLVYILLVGGIPLTALFFIGNSLIHYSADRKIRESISRTNSLFESLDLNSMTAMTTFVEKGKEILADKALKEFFCSTEVAMKHPLVQACFSRFQQAGIPLDSMYLVQFGRRQLLLTSDESTLSEPREVRDFYLPFLHNCFTVFEPDRFEKNLSVLTDFQNWSVQLGAMVFPPEQTRYAGSLRGTGNLYERGDEQIFHLFDFIALRNRIQAALVFRVKASETYWIYLKQLLPPLSRRYPDREFLCLWDSPKGKVWHFPGNVSTKASSKTLIGLMKQVSKVGAGQIKRTDGMAFIGYAGKRMKNLFLGAVVDFRPISAAARWQQIWLTLGSLLIGGLMILVGSGMGGYFLEPLENLETGFRRVLKKDLDIRLQLGRDDELGDVAAAFDKMVGGLKERQELGRFVSGTLNVSVENNDFLPAEPELKSGAILASDIRSFTTISEQNPPEAVVEMLNLHLHVMSDEIKKMGGHIDKFIGDAIIAVFLESDTALSAEKAIRAAQGMMRRHRELYETRTKSGRLCYGMGVGIDTGEILVGTFGSAGRLEFTALGAPRERAEELEAMSKKGLFSKIIVSAKTAGLRPETKFSPLAGTNEFEVIDL